MAALVINAANGVLDGGTFEVPTTARTMYVWLAGGEIRTMAIKTANSVWVPFRTMQPLDVTDVADGTTTLTLYGDGGGVTEYTVLPLSAEAPRAA